MRLPPSRSRGKAGGSCTKMRLKGSDLPSFHQRHRAGLPAEASDMETWISAMNPWVRVEISPGMVLRQGGRLERVENPGDDGVLVLGPENHCFHIRFATYLL